VPAKIHNFNDSKEPVYLCQKHHSLADTNYKGVPIIDLKTIRVLIECYKERKDTGVVNE